LRSLSFYVKPGFAAHCDKLGVNLHFLRIDAATFHVETNTILDSYRIVFGFPVSRTVAQPNQRLRDEIAKFSGIAGVVDEPFKVCGDERVMQPA
jgi:hypothetical protein